MPTSEKWYEKETFGAFWEKGYRNPNISSMGGPSFEVFEMEEYLPRNAKVLDLGCGEGRNALFLAGKEHRVTAVDRSHAGIAKLQNIADRHQIPIQTVVQDITQYPLEMDYDLVMAHGVLYYLENPVWRELLTKVKKHTRPGGFNIFTLFVYTQEYPCGDEIQAASYKHSFYPGELAEFYQDWIQHRFDRYVKWDAHPGIELHYHPIEKLVCQKPLQKIIKKRLDVGPDIPQELFHAIQMGMSREELVETIGAPGCIEKMQAAGVQFGICRKEEITNDSPITTDYSLELWHYGKYQFYIVGGEVNGKALFATEPHALECREE